MTTERPTHLLQYRTPQTAAELDAAEPKCEEARRETGAVLAATLLLNAFNVVVGIEAATWRPAGYFLAVGLLANGAIIITALAFAGRVARRATRSVTLSYVIVSLTFPVLAGIVVIGIVELIQLMR